MKLKKPSIENEYTTTDSFIREAHKSPVKNNNKPTSFVLQQFYRELIDSESNTSRQNRTVILKASLLAFSNMNLNEKNHWILEATKKR